MKVCHYIDEPLLPPALNVRTKRSGEEAWKAPSSPHYKILVVVVTTSLLSSLQTRSDSSRPEGLAGLGNGSSWYN